MLFRSDELLITSLCHSIQGVLFKTAGGAIGHLDAESAEQFATACRAIRWLVVLLNCFNKIKYIFSYVSNFFNELVQIDPRVQRTAAAVCAIQYQVPNLRLRITS